MSDDIKKILEEVLDSRNQLYSKEHADHHEWMRTIGKPFIQKLIQESLDKASRNKKVREAVWVWGTITVLGAITTFLYHKGEHLMNLLFSGTP